MPNATGRRGERDYERRRRVAEWVASEKPATIRNFTHPPRTLKATGARRIAHCLTIRLPEGI